MPFFSKVKFPEHPADENEVVLNIHDVQMIQIAQGIEVGGEYGTL